MTKTRIPWAGVGQAALTTEEFDNAPLFSGEADVVTDSEAIDASVVTALAAFTVMEWNADHDAIQPAVQTSGNPVAGVLSAAYDPAVSTLGKAPYMKTGIFNPDALVWDATFNTFAEKKAFMEAAPMLFLRTIGSPAS